MAYVKKN